MDISWQTAVKIHSRRGFIPPRTMWGHHHDALARCLLPACLPGLLPAGSPAEGPWGLVEPGLISSQTAAWVYSSKAYLLGRFAGEKLTAVHRAVRSGLFEGLRLVGW